MDTHFKQQANHGPRRNKVVSAAEAVRLIHDGDTVATGGFVGIGFAEGIAVALEQRFLATEAETGTGTPRNLTHTCGHPIRPHVHLRMTFLSSEPFCNE